MQSDVKAFFGTYQRACAEADTLLFNVGDANAIDTAHPRTRVGRLLDNALLLLHRDILPEMEPVIRIYESCARALAGEVEEADLIKRYSRKVPFSCTRIMMPPLTRTCDTGLCLRFPL